MGQGFKGSAGRTNLALAHLENPEDGPEPREFLQDACATETALESLTKTPKRLTATADNNRCTQIKHSF
jgi:hypothetical protein